MSLTLNISTLARTWLPVNNKWAYVNFFQSPSETAGNSYLRNILPAAIASNFACASFTVCYRWLLVSTCSDYMVSPLLAKENYLKVGSNFLFRNYDVFNLWLVLTHKDAMEKDQKLWYYALKSKNSICWVLGFPFRCFKHYLFYHDSIIRNFDGLNLNSLDAMFTDIRMHHWSQP